MASSFTPKSDDLLGLMEDDVFSPGYSEPGRTVDLSGASRKSQSAASGYSNGRSYESGSSSSGGGSAGRHPGPASIEGGRGADFSVADLSPANLLRQLASRPVTELVREHGRHLLGVPRYAARAYAAVARRYLRPWGDFLHLRPASTAEGLREASRRGEVQVYLQRNVLSNAREFLPNYVFVFLTTLLLFVCTSPALLMVLGGLGGGWSHALRSEEFRGRPWTLQIGSVRVPLGANMKLAIMALPTLLLLHFFMASVLWPAALCSGGLSVAHAALRDRRNDGEDGEDHGLGPPRARAHELP